MADDEHVADTRMARDALVDKSGIGTGNGISTGTEEAEGAIATATDRPARDQERAVSPAESSSHVDSSPVHPHLRYPLNSRRLTAWHLRALAQALGLPTTGSIDQLRQCIEGIVQRDHDHQNVVVIIRESLKTEHVLVLADSEGEFLVSEPIYRDALPRHMRTEVDVRVTEELRETHRQLEEANDIIDAATAKDEEQARMIAKLQEDLHECEVQATHACEELEQQLAAEKEKARESWRTNCEHLAKQDALITAQDEEVAVLKRRIVELEAEGVRGRSEAPSPGARPPRLSGRPSSEVVVESTLPATGIEVPHPHPLPLRTGSSFRVKSVPVRGDVHSMPHHSDASHSGAAPASTPRRSEGSDDSTQSRPDASHSGAVLDSDSYEHSAATTEGRQRRGKAPPIEFFSGEDPAILLDD